jgi:hypothetical protein
MALMANFTFLTSESIFFPVTYTIFDRTTILILEPKFRFWALMAYFHFLTPKRVYFLHLYKISDRQMTYLIFEPLSAQPRDLTDSKFLPPKYVFS